MEGEPLTPKPLFIALVLYFRDEQQVRALLWL